MQRMTMCRECWKSSTSSAPSVLGFAHGIRPGFRLTLGLGLAFGLGACGGADAHAGSDANLGAGGGGGRGEALADAGGAASGGGASGGGGPGGGTSGGGTSGGGTSGGGASGSGGTSAADAAAPADARTGDAALPDLGGLMPRAVCSGTYARAAEAGILDDERLDEVSGLTPSPRNRDVLWMLNDSGDLARLYAVSTTGHLLGILYLRGVENVDFEDLAAGPCPPGLVGAPGSGACLWVADTGNNGGDRSEFVVHVVPEPVVDPIAGFPNVAAEQIAHYPFRYPDAVRDSEAFALAPDASTFYVFEKVDGAPSHVYRHAGPFVDGERSDLEPVATLQAPGFDIPLGRMITGAAMHPGGRRLLLRVYTGSYEYRLPEGADWASLATVEPLRVAAGPLSEPQGEAITYDHAGSGIYTVSEDTENTRRVPLHFYGCVP